KVRPNSIDERGRNRTFSWAFFTVLPDAQNELSAGCERLWRILIAAVIRDISEPVSGHTLIDHLPYSPRMERRHYFTVAQQLHPTEVGLEPVTQTARRT